MHCTSGVVSSVTIQFLDELMLTTEKLLKIIGKYVIKVRVDFCKAKTENQQYRHINNLRSTSRIRSTTIYNLRVYIYIYIYT